MSEVLTSVSEDPIASIFRVEGFFLPRIWKRRYYMEYSIKPNHRSEILNLKLCVLYTCIHVTPYWFDFVIGIANKKPDSKPKHLSSV